MNYTVTITRPNLTEEERARRMKLIEEAAVRLLEEAAKAKAKAKAKKS